jgi:hypothetical protein
MNVDQASNSGRLSCPGKYLDILLRFAIRVDPRLTVDGISRLGWRKISMGTLRAKGL